MKKQKTIEEMICPNAGKLKTKKGIVTSQILDVELDVLDCQFNNDMCVQIHTKNYNHITLTISNLEDLMDLIYEADEKFSKQSYK